jgi:putative ABC transport system ATP-binding protein
MSSIIHLKHVYKAYSHAETENSVLQDINLAINAGEFVAIVGPSGNGKSTLLNLITGIDHPSQGEVWVNGAALHKLNNEQLSQWRRLNLGIVFQFFQLLPALNLLQNVILPMDFAGQLSRSERTQRAMALLERVGLADQAQRLPSQVSGGQQQRAAIARALANDPPLIVADEPTGNLDSETADAVFELFSHLSDQGKTLVMVTHNETLADAASRKLEIRNGRLFADSQTLVGA